MSVLHRLRSGPLVLAIAVAVAAFTGLTAPSANAFYVQNHEAITRAALPQIPPDVMAQIDVGPPPGAGVVGSDAFFADNFRHLDNARNAAEMCGLALQAWNTFAPVILSGSRVVGGGALADGPAARAAFGGLAHTQQDFYAHSNYVEDSVAIGQPYRIAPPIFPTCDPGAFPADFHTGYFELGASHDDPLAGCPPAGPPPGFPECHAMMNKDGPSTMRGGQPAPGTGGNYYDLAAQLATTATVNLYNFVRSQVAAANGEQAAVLLFGGGGAPPTTTPVDPASYGQGK